MFSDGGGAGGVVESIGLVYLVIGVGQGGKRNGLVLCGAAPGVGQGVGFR